jgi:hypothetical protein
MMQPQQPATKPKRSWYRSPLGCGVLITVLLVCSATALISYAALSATSNTTRAATSAASPNIPANTTQPASTSQQPATQPPKALKWTTVQTITGNGSKKTSIFTEPNDWKIVWSCSGQNINGVTADGLLTVSIYNADGSIAEPGAVNATCKAGQTKTTGETEEHQGGPVYLSIEGTGDWTAQIQELK